MTDTTAGEAWKPLYDRLGYLHDPEGLARMRQSLKETPDWHDRAPINCNSLARLLDTIEAQRLAFAAQPSAGAQGEAVDPHNIDGKHPISRRLGGFAQWLTWCLEGKFKLAETAPKFVAGMRDDIDLAARLLATPAQPALREAEIVDILATKLSVSGAPSYARLICGKREAASAILATLSKPNAPGREG